MFATSQWETVSLCNDVSHWLGASIESALEATFRPSPTRGRRLNIQSPPVCNGHTLPTRAYTKWFLYFQSYNLTHLGVMATHFRRSAALSTVCVVGGFIEPRLHSARGIAIIPSWKCYNNYSDLTRESWYKIIANSTVRPATCSG